MLVLMAMIERQAEEIRSQKETIQPLRDEIAVLHGEKGKPKILPSRLDARTEPVPASAGEEAKEQVQRPGSAQCSKTADLTIHEEWVISPSPLPPPNTRFKGYRDFVVQDLRIAAHHTRYRLEVWQTPNGAGASVNCRRNWKGSTRVRRCAATFFTSITTATLPSPTARPMKCPPPHRLDPNP